MFHWITPPWCIKHLHAMSLEVWITIIPTQPSTHQWHVSSLLRKSSTINVINHDWCTNNRSPTSDMWNEQVETCSFHISFVGLSNHFDTECRNPYHPKIRKHSFRPDSHRTRTQSTQHVKAAPVKFIGKMDPSKNVNHYPTPIKYTWLMSESTAYIQIIHTPVLYIRSKLH